MGILIVTFEYDRNRRKEIEKKHKEELERLAILDQAAKEREVRRAGALLHARRLPWCLLLLTPNKAPRLSASQSTT